jgi:hypothetical protein
MNLPLTEDSLAESTNIERAGKRNSSAKSDLVRVWSKYLETGEKVLWTAQAHNRNTFPGLFVLTAIFLPLIWYFGWFAFVPDDAREACQLSINRRCGVIYYVSWPIFLFCVLAYGGFFITFLLSLLGVLNFYCALTDLRAMTLMKGPRTKFKAVVLGTIDSHSDNKALWFGKRNSPKLIFAELETRDLEDAIYCITNRRAPSQ